MEYEALINRILEAEQTAREITREAHEKQAHMEESLKQEEARIKADYLGAGRPAAGAATPGNRAGKGPTLWPLRTPALPTRAPSWSGRIAGTVTTGWTPCSARRWG